MTADQWARAEYQIDLRSTGLHASIVCRHATLKLRELRQRFPSCPPTSIYWDDDNICIEATVDGCMVEIEVSPNGKSEKNLFGICDNHPWRDA